MDTGSAYTILNAKYRSLAREDLVTPFALMAANGAPIKVYGMANVDIKIGPHVPKHKCYVADTLHNLVGVDMLTHYHIILDPANKSVWIHGQQIDMIIPSSCMACRLIQPGGYAW